MAIYLATPKKILNSQFAIQVMARFKITVQLLQLTSKMETSCKFNLEKWHKLANYYDENISLTTVHEIRVKKLKFYR